MKLRVPHPRRHARERREAEQARIRRAVNQSPLMTRRPQDDLEAALRRNQGRWDR